MNEKDFVRAEQLLRLAIDVYKDTLPPRSPQRRYHEDQAGRVLLRQGHPADAEFESLAGYEILARKADPAVSFRCAARQDLADIYDLLHQADKASRFRAELGAMERGRPGPGSRSRP